MTNLRRRILLLTVIAALAALANWSWCLWTRTAIAPANPTPVVSLFEIG